MNSNNLAQKTNYLAGSPDFDVLRFYLTALNIPGINLVHNEIGGRDSSRIHISSDTINWGILNIDVLIDEDWKVYLDFMDWIYSNINLEKGTFKDLTFSFWIEVTNNKGANVFKVEFNNCRIESIGDIELNTQDDSTENTFQLSLVFDTYEIIKAKQVPVLV